MAKTKTKTKAKKFRVSIGWTSVRYFEVKAATEEKASAIAERRAAAGDDGDDYWESSESVRAVELIKE